ncbi:peptidoglycan DD-metalloendopeptidase family protein [Leptospira sp. GIMC2001]|uniref:peptidoglycan DD-metalloendopeptidase family protein n=1 Tax=Leptospira sp. GIMC2001 TaxID=1513297 RepID=UPI00234AA216|nr:peptidoglycan DD-metalloendopeptidase family protein [Leptospira sp. GIMC2001]WCL49998.1 peptidoglycan DD-metalloendopeptidase family protein [Leptospira sp. GIMC2001]
MTSSLSLGAAMRIYYIAIFLLISSSIAAQGLAKQSFYINKNYTLKGKAYSSDKSEIAPVYVGDAVELLLLEENLMEPGNDWARIRVAEEKEGYIPISYLQKEKPPEQLIKKRDIILYEPQTYFVTASSLVIRSGPGQSFDPITSLPRNSEVSVTRFSDNDDYVDGLAAKWAYVKTQGYSEGWVFSGYLAFQKSSVDTAPENWEHIMSGNTKYVRPPILHIRDEPGKLGTIIGTVNQGKSIKILDRMAWQETITGLRSVWVRIESDGTEGFVFGGFLASKNGLYLGGDHIDKPFIFPIDPNRARRTSPYGYRIHPVLGVKRLHTGLDLGSTTGTPIYAAGDGVVEFQQNHEKEGYGRLTVIRHENGLVTYYAHQDIMHVKRGDKVRAGDTIGEVGNTGLSTGPHLHFEVRAGLNKECFDPDHYMISP